MAMGRNLRRWVGAAGVLAFVGLALFGARHLRDESDGHTMVYGRDPALPTLTFYTTGFATTPQLPFWEALGSGDILEYCNIRVVLWKNLDDLRGVLLAGKGDLWLGHTEGFAQAHAAGAPVTLLLISGWRKFHIVTRDPALQDIDDLAGRDLPFAPADSPAVFVLTALGDAGAMSIRFQPHEPRQLALLLHSGRVDTALVPEPLASTLLSRDASLRVAGSVEQWYGRRTGGPARMPIAGMAVHRETARRHPELIAHLVAAMAAAAQRLQADPQVGVAALPPAFEAYIPREIVTRSLERDPVLLQPAAAVADEIDGYLRMLMPELMASARSPMADPAFLWSPP
ncbi:ABC transporter substrate-binding protein [Desulfatitalea alkaliphila]|uniref:ABC transporter substrate-binding protein n=1 Tax=Desulfatitalea alkaliphila TaxID=2929485 RepID=A0AA41UI71_9BACT|nr:ABC transporter substrate-binding protein [Desulfatitalea alkaliphila]MCJ8499754.1 ABC transporter substrate-binding protein [Desulfatitalea alkaliphila]